ncbi:MAG: hypothetical protein ABIK65_06445 [Candidatus Eisenbacteria bacterium]
MKPIRVLDTLAILAALVMAVASIALGDADKTPLYLLVGYALWRIGSR